MKELNKGAQSLRTIYSENDVDRIENEILRGGEGSGSGSGSGSGIVWSGGLLAGNVIHTEIGFATYEFRISWSEGRFSDSDRPSVQASYHKRGGQALPSTPVEASWIAPYEVLIGPVWNTHIYYSIPSEYRTS